MTSAHCICMPHLERPRDTLSLTSAGEAQATSHRTSHKGCVAGWEGKELASLLAPSTAPTSPPRPAKTALFSAHSLPHITTANDGSPDTQRLIHLRVPMRAETSTEHQFRVFSSIITSRGVCNAGLMRRTKVLGSLIGVWKEERGCKPWHGIGIRYLAKA